MPSSPPHPLGSSRRTDPCSTARLLAEARRWFVFATRHGLDPDYAADKARSALALTMRLAASSRDLAEAEPTLLVPTKLIGTSAFQPTLRQLAAAQPGAGFPLRLETERDRIAALLASDGASSPLHDVPDGGILGLVQAKHAWLVPLVAFGARAVLLQVTGGSPDKPTHGVNLALTGLGDAIRALDAKGARARVSPDSAPTPERRSAA